MIRHGDTFKQEIRRLRADGATYAEIQAEVGFVPKSTLTYICRGVVLDGAYYGKMRHTNLAHLKSARALARDKKLQLREKNLESARVEARRVVYSSESIDISKVSLAMLYLGEGRKTRSYSGLSLGGSDPTTLRLYLGLLRQCYGIDLANIRLSVQYRADQDFDTLVNYWSKQLGVSLGQFYVTHPDPRTAGKPTRRLEYKGVCVVTCRGANIQVELAMIAEEYARKIWGYSSVD